MAAPAIHLFLQALSETPTSKLQVDLVEVIVGPVVRERESSRLKLRNLHH